MGWQDDQIVEEPTATTNWQDDEVVQDEKETPSMLAVAGNAALKGAASIADLPFNIAAGMWNNLTPSSIAPRAMTSPIAHGMEAAGIIKPENEPQTTGQRVLDTSVRAGINMLASPATGLKSAAVNVAQGVASGAFAQMTKEATGSDLLAIAVGMVTPFAMSRAASPGGTPTLTQAGKSTLKDAQAAGYVVQPSTVKPTMATNRLESVAGKAAVAQDAALRNQTVTNRLAAKAIGLPEGTPVTPESLESVRAQAGKVYQEVEDLRATTKMDWFPRYHDTDLFAQLKQARADATSHWKSYNNNPSVDLKKQAQSYDSLAKSIEGDLERIAVAAGKPELIERMKAARMLFARTYDVEQVMNPGTYDISAPAIGRMLQRDHPFTGELKVIGRFAKAFPRAARDAAMVPPPSVSGTDAASSAILGGIGYGAAGGPAGLLAAGLPLLRAPARNLVLSGKYQSRLLKEATPMSESLLKGALVGKAVSDYQEAIP